MFLVCEDRTISDELIDAAFDGFVGENEIRQECMPVFSGEDLKIESLMNECMGGGLFSSRKVVVVRNPAKLTKPKRTAVTNYLSDPNPDVCMIFLSTEDAGIDKTVTENLEDKNVTSKALKNIERINVSPLSEHEMAEWIKIRFDDFEIEEEAVIHILALSNRDLSEIEPEIVKLKTFCHFKRSVDIKDINMCNGISKDFSEGDFIKAIMDRDRKTAIDIYHRISLKRDVEVYLVFLLYTAYCAILKLKDPATSGMQGFNLQRELKLWGPVHGAMLLQYKEVSESLPQDSVHEAINLIYRSDKRFKTSSGSKSVVMTELINGLCG